MRTTGKTIAVNAAVFDQDIWMTPVLVAFGGIAVALSMLLLS